MILHKKCPKNSEIIHLHIVIIIKFHSSNRYWTLDKSKIPSAPLTASFYRTFRYHLGTLAFGSLIIAIIRMIRVMIEYIEEKLKE